MGHFESKVYNDQADWLNDIEENLGTIRKQETLTVTEAIIEKQVKNIPNWLQSGNVPEWLTSGKTVLNSQR